MKNLIHNNFLFFLTIILSTSIISAKITINSPNQEYTKNNCRIFNTLARNFGTKSIPLKKPKQPSIQLTQKEQKSNLKPWLFLAYIAANNNLHSFALQNIDQMMRTGSNNNINILVQFDGITDRKIKRYLIKQGQVEKLAELESSTSTISGTPHSLYQFVKWGYENFPAERIAIDLWNHGSGIKDPSFWGKFLIHHRDDLFAINPQTNLLELNRRMSQNIEINEHGNLYNTDTRSLFEELTIASLLKKRGIAFNDYDEVYIDNQQLRTVLSNVSRNILLDKPIDVVMMDACHMGMVELATQMNPYVNYMIGSSEVEPGSGYNYEYLLQRFATTALTPKDFAIHTVKSYERVYKNNYADYTQAAVELDSFGPVEDAFTSLGEVMKEALKQPESKTMFDLIRVVRLSSKNTTEFYDPDYIDAGHFLVSLINKSNEFINNSGVTDPAALLPFRKVGAHAERCFVALKKSIIAETHGSNLPNTHGLGLFFPKRTIHSSYLKTNFDKKTGWSSFLAQFLNRLRYSRSVDLTPDKKDLVQK